jgi:hypothetical protein
MTTIAKPDQVVVGQMVYDLLAEDQKSLFSLLQVSHEIWSYISDQTGKVYRLYGTA